MEGRDTAKLGTLRTPPMAKASIQLAEGTSVQIDGSPEEIARVLAFYGGKTSPATPIVPQKMKQPNVKVAATERATAETGPSLNLSQIVNLIKTCDEAETIETRILDKSSQLNRILLPLYIICRYLDNAVGLTSGEISQITKELGIPVSQPNASRTLSGTASRYIVGDKVRKKGQPVRYKLSRRGLQYLSEIMATTRKS